jgi:hypothetical protein
MKKRILLMTGLIMILITVQAQWVQFGSEIEGINSGDKFGNKVSLSDDGLTFVSGSHNNDQNGTDAGMARVFHYSDGDWTQVGSDILGAQANEGLGYSVSLNGDGSILAVGSPNYSGAGGVTGCVRIYQNNGGSWTQLGETIIAETEDDLFGNEVSLNADGTIVACSAPFFDGTSADMGNVRVFQLTGDEWVQLGDDIVGEGEANYSGYGLSINADGTIVAIGAPENTDVGNEAGHVRVYQLQSGAWVQMGSDIDAESAGDYLGYQVSLNDEGNILAASAIFDNLNGTHSGSIFVYEFINGDWEQVGNTITGEAEENNFGVSVSLNAAGDIVAGGAPTNSGVAIWAGNTRVFQLQDDEWIQIGDDIDGDAQEDQSGTSVSLSADGAMVAIGAIQHNLGAGQVRVFKNATVGVDEKEMTLENVSIYPNPATDRVTLDLSDNNSPDIYLYDITGKKVYHKHLQSANKTLSIDLSDFMSGVYLVKIYDNHKMYSGKIIKK